MRVAFCFAALLLAGCAQRGAGAADELPQSERGFATEGSMACARVVLEQRGYTVHPLSPHGVLRAEKSLDSGGRDLLVRGLVTARLAPSTDGRTTLWVRTTRRVTHSAPTRGPRPRTSGHTNATEPSVDAAIVLRECTRGPA